MSWYDHHLELEFVVFFLVLLDVVELDIFDVLQDSMIDAIVLHDFEHAPCKNLSKKIKK